MVSPDDYQTIAKLLLRGKVVPFLGAGVNLCGSDGDGPVGRFPSGSELAEHLARYAGYRSSDRTDLARVSQFISLTEGLGNLYEVLHEVFDADHPPTVIHHLLAELAGLLRERGVKRQLIVTTNYDDALERAFDERSEQYDLVTYVATETQDDRLWHHRPVDGEVVAIERPNEYDALSLETRTVILKVHGAVNRQDADGDSFVITEEDYLDYLARADAKHLLPATLASELRLSNLLFLGYSLADWNLRVILHRIWHEQRVDYRSWAVQRAPSTIDQRMWGNRGVTILDEDLAVVADRLHRDCHDLMAEARGG